ncbi:hypothetical protein JCM8097_001433 [Rhodosporidiobolus ruineniae]
MSLHLYPIPLLIALLVAHRGLRSNSLSRSGAVAAAALGYAAVANPLGVFGVCLLGFYVAGSRATKVKAAIKATYEEPDHAPAPSSSSSATGSKPPKAGGNRSAAQVACNALGGVLCAATWRVLYSGERGVSAWGDEGRWCVVGRYAEEDARRWSRPLVIVAVAFWAACCGDTLGILSTRPPFLLTTLRPAPRGTNGAVSAWGTLVSLLGGVLVGGMAVAALAVQGQFGSGGCEGVRAGELVGVGAVSGFGGSLVDSLLGALFQPTYYSPSRKLVVHHPPLSTSSVSTKTASEEKDDTVLLPGTALLGSLLSNNGVNVASTVVVAGVAGWYALRS